MVDQDLEARSQIKPPDPDPEPASLGEVIDSLDGLVLLLVHIEPVHLEKKSKGAKKLEKFLAYHQRLLVEKGLPPSRLMEEHAALSTPPPAKSSCGSQFECERCDFASDTQRGLKVHIGKRHKNTEVLRDEKHEVSLVLSEHGDEVRDDIVSTVGGANESQSDEGVSSFISALKNTFNLWPEDDPPHRCPPWERFRNLKCRVKAVIESQYQSLRILTAALSTGFK